MAQCLLRNPCIGMKPLVSVNLSRRTDLGRGGIHGQDMVALSCDEPYKHGRGQRKEKDKGSGAAGPSEGREAKSKPGHFTQHVLSACSFGR